MNRKETRNETLCIDCEMEKVFKISFGIYENFMEDMHKQHPTTDFGMIAFEMFSQLSIHLCLYDGWTTTDLIEHLTDNVDDIVKDVKEDEQKHLVS